MTTSAAQPDTAATPPDADPWRYGWRYVRRPLPLDSEHWERVPLTLQDVLHPEVGDFIVHSDRHETDRMYLAQVLRARLEPPGVAIVLSDVRIAWDMPDIRPHGPDVMVIPGLRERRNWSTFEVAVEGTRPMLIIEITSPETRRNDLFDKVEHYARAGVAQYVIVDDIGRGGERRLRLLGYRLALDVYQPRALDDHGRLWLDVAGLWLGVQDDHVVCYDEQGGAIGDYTAVVRAAAEAQQRADAEERARAQAEERASAAEERAAVAAHARADAEERAAAEARARADAEERAAAEARARADAEERLRALEAELRRLRATE